MRKPAWLWLLALTACGGSAATGPGGAGGASAATGATATASSGSGLPTGPTFSASFGPVTVASGEEHTQCVVKRVGNDKAVHIGAIHNALSTASHHLIVYRTNDTMEQPTPFACQPFSDLLHPEKGTPLMISQKHDDTLELPKGVALSFAPGQMVRLEMHYINTTSATVSATATSTFYVIPDADVQAEADFLFVGDPDINLPPHSKVDLGANGPIYMPLTPAVGDAKFFGVTGHEHRFGTNVTVAVAPGPNGPDTSVYDVPNWLWSEPATVMHDPPFQVPQGGGFHFRCSWDNTSDKVVKFGESATAEMCFFWAYYYPSKGAYVCAHTDQVPGGYDLCCPGNPYCDKLFP